MDLSVSLIFGGFSAEAVRDRIVDCRAKLLVTGDEVSQFTSLCAPKSLEGSPHEEKSAVSRLAHCATKRVRGLCSVLLQGRRGGKIIPLKVTADQALIGLSDVKVCPVWAAVEHSVRVVQQGSGLPVLCSFSSSRLLSFTPSLLFLVVPPGLHLTSFLSVSCLFVV